MRTPPKFIEGEKAILGGLLLDNDAIAKAVAELRPEEFAAQQHRAIYSAVTRLFQNDRPVDLITLPAELRRLGLLDEAGGIEYLTALIDEVPSIANISHYIGLVRDKALRREAIFAAREMAEAAYDEQTDIAEAVDRAERAVFGLSERRLAAEWHDMTSLAQGALRFIAQVYERQDAITGVPSGFADLDELTAGWQRSDLIILAGRPSMGKTALALDFARHAAANAGVPTAFFSLEMSHEQIGIRLLCGLARMDASKLRRGYLSDGDWGRLTTAVGNLSDAKLYVDDRASLTPLEMRAIARRLKREKGIGLLVVDYLQLMRAGQRMDSREREISEISRALKAMAKELDIPVIALSQLNRKLEDRGDKRPQLADLRESGAIEQDADLVVFVFRDDAYNKSPDNPRRGEAEVIIGKQRNGPTGTVKLTWSARWSTFLPRSSREE